MVAARKILDRLVAAGKLLEEPSPRHAQTSQEQADCILAMLEGVPLRASASIELADAVGGVKWANGDRRRLLDAITSRAVDGGRSRAPLQNYETVPTFLTDSIWEGLQSSADMHAKGRLIVDHAISLGLRNPTEGTSAVLTAVLLIAHDGPMKARSLERWFTRDIFLFIKKLIKQRVRAPPLEIIVELPATPQQLQHLYPETFDAIFASSSAVPCSLSLADLAAVKSGIMLRDRARTQTELALPGSQQPQDWARSLGAMLMQALGMPCGNGGSNHSGLSPPAASMSLPGGGNLILTQTNMSRGTPLKRSVSALSLPQLPPPPSPAPLADACVATAHAAQTAEAPTAAAPTVPAPTVAAPPAAPPAAPALEAKPTDGQKPTASGSRGKKPSRRPLLWYWPPWRPGRRRNTPIRCRPSARRSPRMRQ